MDWESTPEYEIIPVGDSSTDKGNVGYIIKINLNSGAFGDSIFEINDDVSDSLMRVYSLWVETNALYRVVESIMNIYGCDDVGGNKKFMDISFDDEIIKLNEMYDYLFDFCGDNVLRNRKVFKYGWLLVSETDVCFSYLKENLDSLRGRVVDNKNELEDRIPDSYHFGDLLAETVPKLMNLCSDDGNGIQWYTEICFNRVNYAKRFQEIIYPVLKEQNCDSYGFTGEVFVPKKVDWDKIKCSGTSLPVYK